MLACKGIHEIYKNFAANTSIHGLLYIATKRLRKLWALFFFIVFAICFWQCKNNVDTYFSYGVRVKNTMNRSVSMDFPAITFSTYYEVKKSGISKVLAAPFFAASVMAIEAKNIKRLSQEVYTLRVLLVFEINL